MKLPVYLDYSATTPCDPRVVEKMVPYLNERFGNPASHTLARIRRKSFLLRAPPKATISR